MKHLPNKPILNKHLLIFVLTLSCSVMYLELQEVPMPGFVSNVTAEIFVLSAVMLSAR